MTAAPGLGPFAEKLSDGSLAQRVQLMTNAGASLLNAGGKLPIALNENVATYGAIFSGYTTTGVAIDDWFTLENPVGSGKLIRLISSIIRFKSSGAAGSLASIFVVKRSALNSGGTNTQPTPFKYRTSSGAQVGIVRLYTTAVGAGLGASVFSELAGEYTPPVSTAAFAAISIATNLALGASPNVFNEPLCLAPGEVLGWNHNNVAFQANCTSRGNIVWTEEANV